MEKNIKYKKITSWDWKQKLSLFLYILIVLVIITSLLLLITANFQNHYNVFLGNGFWSLKYYGIVNLFHNWNQLDIDAAKNADVSHPFLQVYFAILFLMIITPIFFIIATILLIRAWWKSRI